MNAREEISAPISPPKTDKGAVKPPERNVQIRQRYSDDVLFEGDYPSVKMAVAAAGRAGVSLENADLREADLMGAGLGGARLEGTHLEGAYLGSARLAGADLIDAGQDRRGFRFIGCRFDGGVWVAAGCRWLSISDARAHWGEGYPGDAASRTYLGDRVEINAKLDLIEATAKSRGWDDVT